MHQAKKQKVLHISLWDYAYRWWLKAQYKYTQTQNNYTEIHILNGQAACV